jgi:hypothetical protein
MKNVLPLVLAVAMAVMAVAPVLAAEDEAAQPQLIQINGTAPMAATPGAQLTPEQRAQMQDWINNSMVMMQNTAVWSDNNLFVLQGNRILQYGPDLNLVRQTSIPLPQQQAEMPPVRGMVPTRLIATDTGLVLIRGQQVFRMDDQLNVVAQATLPDLPPLTATETAAICPMCAQMAMMNGMMIGMTPPVVGMAPETGPGVTPSAIENTPAEAKDEAAK